jgi:fatty acid omega-hydroxylase
VLREEGVFGSTVASIKVIVSALKKGHLEHFCNLHARIGKTFACKLPLQPWWLVTACPKNVEHILSKNFQNYPKGSYFLERLSDLLGNGIFNADGKEWLHQRKTASHMFTAKLFKEHIWVVVCRNARKLCDGLLAAGTDKPVDMFNFMNRFTLDTIGEIGFGRDIGSLDDPTSPFLRSFDMAQQIAFRRFWLPHWRLLRRLGIGSEKDTAEHLTRLDEYSRKVVRDLQQNIEKEDEATKSAVDQSADIEARKSFVGLFIADAAKRKETLTEDFLRDLVLNFLIAGRDTTAQALSWTLYCLCQHPDAIMKAREEIKEICGVRGPAYDDMKDLSYLQAVLNEALRLYPSVPVDTKTTESPDTLPDGTYLPRGTVVMYNMYAMARDTSLWGPDADVFRPERWLEMQKAPSNYEYPVFNAGPRECLGRRLAQVEMKTCLAILLPHLSFQLAVPPHEIIHDGQLTIGMGRGLPCYVQSLEEKSLRNLESSTTAANSDTLSMGSEEDQKLNR